MFSENQKISMRQVYRLFVFDLIGVCTLELPAKLAYDSASDGLIAIVAGGALASAYLWYLGRIIAGMNCDLITYMENNIPAWLAKAILLFLAFHAVLEAGFGAYVFSDVMQRGLIPGESYTLILVLILLLAGYAVQGGIESRARIYEVLYPVLAVLLLLMFLVAAFDVDWSNVGPFFTSQPSHVVKGGILEVFCFIPLFAVVFFPAYVHREKEKKLVPTVMAALWSAVLVLFLLYLLLLGTFGSGALASMRYPAVTLMSSIHLRSSFLKRFDAFMLGIWFFTLFALINLYLFYGTKILAAVFAPRRGNAKNGMQESDAGQKKGMQESDAGQRKGMQESDAGQRKGMQESDAGQRKGMQESDAGQRNGMQLQEKSSGPGNGTRRICLLFIMVLAFVTAVLFRSREGEELFINYLCYIGMPLLILLPGLALVAGKMNQTPRGGKAVRMLPLILVLTAGASSLAGCSATELEDRCFPMLAAVDYRVGQVEFAYGFPQLGQKENTDEDEAKVNVPMAPGADFAAALVNYESQLEKKADCNHLKVLVCSREFAKQQKELENILACLRNTELFPRNIYVCVTEDMRSLWETEGALPTDLGSYLESFLLNHEPEHGSELVTLGTLLDETQNRRKVLHLPYLTVDNDAIVWDGEWELDMRKF